MDSNKILDTDTENLTEEEKLERFKKLTDILSRDISRRLDEINSHIKSCYYPCSPPLEKIIV